MKKMVFLLVVLAIILVGCTKEKIVMQYVCSDGTVASQSSECQVQEAPACEVVVQETCTDGIKNQNEVNTDCAGVCPKCANSLSCSVNDDCLSSNCLNGLCTSAEPLPIDKPLVLTAAEVALLNEHFNQGTKAALSRTYAQNVKPGDTVVIALGITNAQPRIADFIAEITFKSATNPNMNPLNVNSAPLNKWSKDTNTGPYSIETRAQKTLPIIFKVPNDELAVGNYVFDILVRSRYADDPYRDYDSFQFTIRIV